ncbi:hypothetical protein EOT10_40585 [Streptomyces antnestii]|uniref:Uncharacterized protein n=1 Tax=Streptomyces antnestii TaxID=2494256 RepID=A0A437NX68_9ACTN|nr:hypothetical protein [Streptomyces sp. San01]RVU14592.1 hypothetical protein EOT10_40585 [Streptomyces sp. San01]
MPLVQACPTHPSPYRVRADGWFECPAGHELHPGDIDLDGPTVWAVDGSGVLRYVVDPTASLEEFGDVLDALAQGVDDCPDPLGMAHALIRMALSSCLDYVDAFRVGIAKSA